MTWFRWSAVDSAGAVLSGVMEAPDRASVVERLQRQGQLVLRADPADRRRRLGDLLNLELGGKRRLNKAALVEATRELSIMLAAGQDLDRALRFVVENAGNGRAHGVLGAVRDRVRAGSSLAAALNADLGSFPQLYVGMVRAGEAGGTLAATLARLASLLEREHSLRANLRSAMVYPAMLVIAAISSIALLLEYVLPQFVPLFEQAGAQLPAATRIMIAFGAGIGAAGPYLVVGSIAAAVLARRALASPAARLEADRWLLRLPLIGQLMRETMAARLTRTLGTLLENGMPLIAALAATSDALGNLAAAEAVNSAAAKAKSGGGLAGPLGEAKLFPSRTIHLLQLGEETAQLPAMALRAAEIHEEQVRLMVQRMVALAVPVITIVMGLLVAGIIGSLLTALLSLNDLAG